MATRKPTTRRRTRKPLVDVPKTTAKTTKPKRERKFNDKVLARAFALRAEQGFGFLRVARAIEDEFKIQVSPHSLRQAMLRSKGVTSLNDVAKGEFKNAETQVN